MTERVLHVFRQPDPALSFLERQPLSLGQCVQVTAARPVAVRTVVEQRVEERLQDEHDRFFDHAVLDVTEDERPFAAARPLGDPPDEFATATVGAPADHVGEAPAEVPDLGVRQVGVAQPVRAGGLAAVASQMVPGQSQGVAASATKFRSRARTP